MFYGLLAKKYPTSVVVWKQWIELELKEKDFGVLFS